MSLPRSLSKYLSSEGWTVRAVSLITLIGISLPPLLDAGGFALSGTGVVPQGMAGAASAWVQDFSALYWNPAGLAAAHNEIALSGVGIHPVITYTPKTGLYYYDGGYAWRTKVANRQGMTPVPSGGITYLLPDKNLSLALGAFVPYGLGGAFDLFDLPVGYYAYDSTFTPQDAPTYPQYDWESNLQDIVIALGVAKNFDRFQVGLALGGGYTRVTLRRPVAVFTENPDLPIQYSHFFLDQKMQVSAPHLYAALGARFQPSPKFSVGVSVRGGTDPSLKGTADLTLYLPYNRYIVDQIAQTSTPEDTVLFLGGVRSSQADVSATLPFPWTYAAGMAWRPVPNLLLAYDLTYTTWGRLQKVEAKLDGVDPLGNPLENDTLTFLWKNTIRHSVGAMYSLERVSFRGGIYYDPSPIPERTLTPLIPDIGGKWGFNLGFSYWATPKIRIDGHYEILYTPDRDFTQLSDADGDLSPDNMPGTYSLDLQAIELGAAYLF